MGAPQGDKSRICGITTELIKHQEPQRVSYHVKSIV